MILLGSICLTHCDGVFEDKEVDVTLKNSAPKLVVEGLINWEKGTSGNKQTIKLSESSDFFSKQQRVRVSGASVSVESSSGKVFVFAESATEKGDYVTTSFEPVLNEIYTLIIFYKGEEIRAEETMKSVTGIGEISQEEVDILGEKIQEVTVMIQDPLEEENFYFLEVLPDFQEKKNVEFFEDEFLEGNEFPITFSSEYEDPNNNDEIREYQSGDVIEIRLLGISEQFYEYYNIINEQSDPDVGPFSLAPAQGKGNCLNITNPENRPLGYFRLSEVVKTSYTYK